ncbi:hypothetical protein SASPL_141446 [Salvia splendens]|uniref:BHLH domain-containing protein n=1 Tax=Salvia splendens TaxID=180675 RepID=A0A8X8ZCV5_SALSN|nr:hypothetical protein SASPL_141446 [Salvia splendens]
MPFYFQAQILRSDYRHWVAVGYRLHCVESSRIDLLRSSPVIVHSSAATDRSSPVFIPTNHRLILPPEFLMGFDDGYFEGFIPTMAFTVVVRRSHLSPPRRADAGWLLRLFLCDSLLDSRIGDLHATIFLLGLLQQGSSLGAFSSIHGSIGLAIFDESQPNFAVPHSQRHLLALTREAIITLLLSGSPLLAVCAIVYPCYRSPSAGAEQRLLELAEVTSLLLSADCSISIFSIIECSVEYDRERVMEISTQHSLLEELIIDSSFSTEFFQNTWNFAQSPDFYVPSTNPSFMDLISPPEFGNPFPFFDALTSPELGSLDDPPPMSIHDDYAAATMEVNTQISGERKSKSKKPQGQPSKNLMAERRRRKRLNDRLSMLRSIVPKISKMDRTSILGDTIDYMRELLDKIHKLREEGVDSKVMEHQMQLRNPPKDAEQRAMVSSEDVKQALFTNAGYGGRCL